MLNTHEDRRKNFHVLPGGKTPEMIEESEREKHLEQMGLKIMQEYLDLQKTYHEMNDALLSKRNKLGSVVDLGDVERTIQLPPPPPLYANTKHLKQLSGIVMDEQHKLAVLFPEETGVKPKLYIFNDPLDMVISSFKENNPRMPYLLLNVEEEQKVRVG